MTVMRKIPIRLLAGALVLSALALSGAAVNAQGSKGPPNALQGFSQNRDEPVHIDAATLEVRDRDKMATFTGDVHVTQGDTGLRCQTLRVFYEGGGDGDSGSNDSGKNDANKSMAADTAGPGGQQKIKRLEANGGVVVTQKEQTAAGDVGIFDMRSNTVTLSGNVTMTQGKNILRGEKLVVDLGTGVSRVESGKNGNGRVQALIQPGGGSMDIQPSGNAGAPHGKSKPSSPLAPPISLQPFR